MQIRVAAAAFVIAVCLSTAALAQDPAPAESPCPNLEVSGLSFATVGDKITFTVNVSDGDPNVEPTYNWTVSDGFVEEGQGTSSITVSTEGAASATITATVDVGGYSRECSTSDSATTDLEPKKTGEEEQPAEDAKPPR